MLLTNIASDITIGQAAIYALLGYAVVFFGLILLMIVVIIFGKCLSSGKQCEAENTTPATATAEAPFCPPIAPGSAGEVKLHGVEPKTAAMLMAIVADKLGKPVNELRFISIKEVSE